MRASSNRLADDDGLRVGDADRDEAIGHLRDRFAEGRLSQDTFLYRVDVALRAKDRAELDGLFTDLPAPVPRPGWRARALRRIGLGRIGLGEPASPRDVRLAGQLAPGQRQARHKTGAMPAWQALPDVPPLWLPPAEDRRFTIGRAMACDFTLADLSVSRWHARLYRKDDAWLLSDLGSTNGTRLNGWRVTTGVPVRPGDQVTFGSVTFVIADRTAS